MLSHLWQGKQNKVLGLDIGASAVRLVELSRTGGRYRLERFAIERMPMNAMSENDIKDVNAVASTVRRAFLRSGSKVGNSAVAVSSSQVIIKTITMPAGFSESELEEQILVEAAQYIPYPMEEVNLDFCMGDTVGDGELVEVLLVASRSENVDARIAVLEQAGLNAAVMDVETFALENAFPLVGTQMTDSAQVHTVALINIGDATTTLAVLRDGNGIYTREQMFGDIQLTEAIQQHYGLSFEQAEQARQNNELPEDFNSEVLPSFRKAIAQQASRLLQFFFSASGVSHVDHVLLSGECATIPDVAAAVAELTGISTSIASPFSTMALSSNVAGQELEKEAPAMMIACGLALRSFDE
ncbi:MAG TPA: pilus assembly protein PilM [Gammaproteobacteria bacterium]|nr:pilus assembly protein PilM [Gammaproteobacteria bacterium]